MSKLPFDKPGATVINLARLHHLATLNLPLAGKRVLEVGAGVGKLTWFFEEELGCEIVSTDGRRVNCAMNLIRHPWRERRVFVADLEQYGDHQRWGRFDIVFCYGTLYHLATPAQTLAELASICGEMFLLSTRVWPTSDGDMHLQRDTTKVDESLRGRGCRPSRSWIMSRLKEAFDYVYMSPSQPNHSEFPLSWVDAKWSNKEARAVFVASRKPIESLTDEMMIHVLQTRTL